MGRWTAARLFGRPMLGWGLVWMWAAMLLYRGNSLIYPDVEEPFPPIFRFDQDQPRHG